MATKPTDNPFFGIPTDITTQEGFTREDAVKFQEQKRLGEQAPPVDLKAPETTTVEPTPTPVVNRGELETNIKKTLATPGIGTKQANKEFINAVAQLKLGRDASADELARTGTNEFGLIGLSVKDVLGRFGATDLAPNFGVKLDEDVVDQAKGEAPVQPAPKKDGVISAIDELIATKQSGIADGVDTQEFLTKKQEAATAAEVSRQAIADKQLLDAVELENIATDKPIPMTLIRRQQAKFTADQYIDNLKMAQSHNNNVILAQMAQGNFLEAQRINQQISADNFEIEKLKIDRARQQGIIDDREAELLRLDEETAFERAKLGYTLISDPSKLSGLTENDIIRVGDKIYKKPVEETTGDFQFVGATENQPGGVFNKDTGTFTLFGGTTGTDGGFVSTSTGETYDIGSYATDPNHENAIQGMLNKMGQFKTVDDIDRYINSVAPTSKITGEMVQKASEKHGVSWEIITAIMQQDSSLGTKGLGAKNNNPGNIGQFDSLGTEGVAGYKTLQEGVDAVAANLAWRKKLGVELDPEVSSFVKQVQDGSLTTNQALNEVTESKKPALIEALASVPTPVDTEADIVAKEKMQAAIDLKDHKGLNSSVGPVPLTRVPLLDVFGAKQDFTAKIEQLISDLSLESLIEAKSRGATFGALSDTEMQILSSAATTMASWRKRNIFGDGVDHYSIDEKRFKEELDKISKIFKRAIKGTITEDDDVSQADPLQLGINTNTSNSTNPLAL